MIEDAETWNRVYVLQKLSGIIDTMHALETKNKAVAWCDNNLDKSTWMYLNFSFYFKNSEDTLLFKIKFNL